MFTGIIQAIGVVDAINLRGGDARVAIRCPADWLEHSQIGDSLAVNGCCLTATALESNRFHADVSGETLRLTTLGQLRSGQRVNLETALTLATPLGGHLVSGHVDGMGSIQSRHEDARSLRLDVQVPTELARYIAAKGSISIDGTSLTVNTVTETSFSVNIVPHTQHHTIITDYRVGTVVNLEVDLIARYLERLLTATAPPPHSNITRDFLAQHGFGS